MLPFGAVSFASLFYVHQKIVTIRMYVEPGKFNATTLFVVTRFRALLAASTLV